MILLHVLIAFATDFRFSHVRTVRLRPRRLVSNNTTRKSEIFNTHTTHKFLNFNFDCLLFLYAICAQNESVRRFESVKVNGFSFWTQKQFIDIRNDKPSSCRNVRERRYYRDQRSFGFVQCPLHLQTSALLPHVVRSEKSINERTLG